MTLEVTHRRREAVETIHDVVSAMRAIAAGRIQGAQHALAGARRYEEIVWQGLAALPAAALHLPYSPRGAPTLLVVMMSEQPLCGPFNQDLLAFVDRRRRELRESGPLEILVVGGRGARLLVSHGIEPTGSLPAAASLHGLRDVVKQLAGLVGKQYATGQLSAVRVAYNRYQSISEHVPTETQVLPPDLAPLSSALYKPFHRYLSDAALLAGLASELAFISMYRIAADSYASEQAARLIAMDGATRSTERLLKDLTELEQRERQEEITRQVLELIGARFAAI
ncbi:MAG TPA: F0F1 ATP synthase subunit gamma [Pirellulaceae bacterium]|nr:F0F1 ATP synthase subunit gamma [Pirellulaceae bacterium]